MQITIKSDKITARVDTLGAELCSVIGTDGHEYIYSGTHWGGHAPLLFPVCGSLLDGKYTTGGVEYSLAKHGFARRSEFEVVEAGEDYVKMTLAVSEKTLACYPFEFRLSAEYRVDGECLSADFTVENRDEKVMPYLFGWHPAFTLGGEGDIGGFMLDFGCDGPFVMHPLKSGLPFLTGEEVEFPLESGLYRLDERQIYENDTLILTGTPGEVRLYGAGDIHEVEVKWSENLPYLCIWKWPDSAARYLCIEPWSGVPSCGEEAENFDEKPMDRLPAGESAVYSYTVVFTK